MGNAKTLKMIQEILDRQNKINRHEEEKIRNVRPTSFYIDDMWNTQEHDAERLAKIGIEEIYQ